MSRDPKSIQSQLKSMEMWKQKMQHRGVKSLSEEALRASIAEEDAQRFAMLKQQRQQQTQKSIQASLTSSDVNPAWTMEAVQSFLHQPNPDEDFLAAFRVLNICCENISAHQKSGGVCWMLLGAYGRGKSTLAGALYHEYIRRHYSAIMIQWPKLIRHVWSGGEPSKKLLEQIYHVDLLVLDEVGYDQRNLRDQEQALLSTIIRNRKSNCRSLVICSNHFPRTFEEAIGRPSAQGLRDYQTYPSVFEGKSHRQELFTDLDGHSVADVGFAVSTPDEMFK